MFGFLPITEGLTSAPVIVNVGKEDTDVTLTFYNSSGETIKTETLSNLKPMLPFTVFANTLLPGVNVKVQLIAHSQRELIAGAVFVFNLDGEPSIGNTTSLQDH